MSNTNGDTREALAAAIKELIEEYLLAATGRGNAPRARGRLYAQIDRLAASPPQLTALTDQPAAPTEPDDYGHTEHLCFAGVPMSDAAKRLGSMLVKAFGPRHPAVDDFAALALATQPAAPQAEPLTDEQIDRINCEMWASCPLDLPQGRMFARAIERAHGIGAAPAAPAQEPAGRYTQGYEAGMASCFPRMNQLLDENDELKREIRALKSVASAPAQEPQPPEQAAQALVDELVTELLAASSPAPAVQDPQQPAPTVQVLGVKADGSEHDLGTIPEVLAPKFKMREIVRSYFGHFEEGDDSQADMCMIALEEFQRWYKAGLDAVAKQPAASSPARQEPQQPARATRMPPASSTASDEWEA